MKKSLLRAYARLIVRKGVNVQKGQDVMILAELDQPDFVCLVTDECYKAGARHVRVEWTHQPLTKLEYRKCSTRVLSKMEDWQVAKLAHRAETLPAMIYLESEDPNGLLGIDQAKVSRVRAAKYPIIKPYRDKMENKYQWCIAGVAGKKWAKRVFPDLKLGSAVEKLWEMILYTSRALEGDPVENWNAHNADLSARCRRINDLHPVSLHYTSANGTDLTVGLIPEGQFLGGEEITLGGVNFNPNIPSEEVFTSPMKGQAEGIVKSSRPLSYNGELIENFSVTFHEGKAVDCKAEKGESLLRTIISSDESSCYLGECALVPYDSPIRNSGVMFLNTLYDENACCHLALGFGFPNCIRGYETMTLEQCRALGVNDSRVHVDFMIGTADLSIDAIDRDGNVTPIFRNGGWAF
ncbi:MAG: aminopeptidase [Eubacteriales bacterium]|nr:aminopeptidase [Eubacteriales bacterium]